MRPGDMSMAIIRNLPARTGRTIDEWIEICRRDGHRIRLSSAGDIDAEVLGWLAAAYDARA